MPCRSFKDHYSLSVESRFLHSSNTIRRCKSEIFRVCQPCSVKKGRVWSGFAFFHQQFICYLNSVIKVVFLCQTYIFINFSLIVFFCISKLSVENQVIFWRNDSNVFISFISHRSTSRCEIFQINPPVRNQSTCRLQL